MGANVGRDTIIQFAAGLETANPAGLTFKTLGMMRSKSISFTWDTADTTADSSPDYTRTNLVTFKSVEISGDGVSYDDDVHNQDDFESAVVNPGVGTNYQPKVWLKLVTTLPGGDTRTYQGPFIVSEFSREEPYDDAGTFSLSAQSNGAVTKVVA